MLYHSISEGAARKAKHANSYSDYKEGSATKGYRHMVDEAIAIANTQKKKVDPMYHNKIDRLLETYCRKLAENINRQNEIDARVPSILITGGSNFPVRAKRKQNAARDKNMEEYNYIQGLLGKIRSTGTGGISSDDPNAINKLKAKLANLENNQKTMKAVNTYYRKHKTFEGCPHLANDTIKRLEANIIGTSKSNFKPFEGWALSNNNANIRRIRERIAILEKRIQNPAQGWDFEGGNVVASTEKNRLQIFFDDKPDKETRNDLKSRGFRWAPSQGAWQRQLTDNAIYAAKQISAIMPSAPKSIVASTEEPASIVGLIHRKEETDG